MGKTNQNINEEFFENNQPLQPAGPKDIDQEKLDV